MSKVEYTEANREKLATAVVDNMALKDMIQALSVSYTHLRANETLR